VSAIIGGSDVVADTESERADEVGLAPGVGNGLGIEGGTGGRAPGSAGVTVRSRWADGIRRILDVVAAAGGLIVLSPVLIGAALATRVTAGRGVVYRQRRLGRGGRPFELLKFRSMRHPKPGREDPEFDAERLTSVGRWLRATSVDELPSLWNLLRGEITLVGPRPLPVHYWDRFVGDEYERFEVRPGITGLA
jgi:lipopolysaccharide/colanic/teichoic acid biosynthesis glycosyltransferase